MVRIRSKRPKTLRPVHPNAGIEMDYRRRLLNLIDEMNRSVLYWVMAAYRQNEPKMAQDDALPSSALRSAVRKLAERWQKRFDEAGPAIAEYFGKSVTERSDAALMSILRKGGFSVRFKMTAAARDVMNATVNQQVSLIRSIPSEYFTQIEGMVMRSVQTGRDLEQLTKDLQEHFGVTRRRAILIARDQNNKATAAMTRARQTELGIGEAIWIHSGGGKHPRRTHVEMNGKRYDVKKGMWDKDEQEYVLPGQLINCRCVSRSVVPGFS